MTIKIFSFFNERRAEANKADLRRQWDENCEEFRAALAKMNLGDAMIIMEFAVKDRRSEAKPHHLQDFGNAMCRLGDIADREVA